jgi:hypothetical protein
MRSLFTTLAVRLTFTEPLLGTASGNPEIHRDFIASKIFDEKKGNHQLTSEEKRELVDEEIKAIPGRNYGEQKTEDDPDDKSADGPDDKFEKLVTVFPRADRDANQPILWDYQLRGFFKEALRTLSDLGELDQKHAAHSAIAGAVDRRLFIHQRQTAIFTDQPITIFQRSLRTKSGPKGPRVCFASSERIASGATLDFDVELYESFSEKVLSERVLKKNPQRAPKKRDGNAAFTSDDIKAALDWGQRVGIGQWRSGGFGRFTWASR